MKVPDKFPAGCEFVASFSGDEFVSFPDGKVFKLSDDGLELKPVSRLPLRNAAPMSEAGFRSAVRSARDFKPGVRPLLNPAS